MITIEQIDKVMELTGKSYKEVREALIKTDGDILKASDLLTSINSESSEKAEETVQKVFAEEAGSEDKTESRKAAGPDIVETIVKEIKAVWDKGNASSLLIEKNGETVIKLSLTVGTIGFVLAAVPSIIGLGAAILSDYQIKIIMDDGQIIDLTKKIRR